MTAAVCCAEDVNKRSLCKLQLGPEQTTKFKQAITDDYYFEMMLGSSPASFLTACHTL